MDTDKYFATHEKYIAHLKHNIEVKDEHIVYLTTVNKELFRLLKES